MKELKTFLTYKIKASFLIVLTLILFFLTLTGILFLEREVQKSFLYASAVRLSTELKYLQIISIVEGSSFIFSTFEEGKKYQIFNETKNTLHLEDAPLYSRIKILPDKETIKIITGGFFENDSTITLTKRGIKCLIKITRNGKIIFKED